MRPPLHDEHGRPLGRGGLAFTAEQAVAVQRREGPMLLAANAGSGKTAVLAERFARAVVQDGIEPSALLAITFTDKAAGELRHRIRERLLELGARDAARTTDQAWISTIHGFCTRLLRAHAAAAGVDPAFEVLDESTARGLRADAFDAALAETLDAADERTLTVIATWGPDRLAGAVRDAYEALRSRGQRRPGLPAAVARRTPAEACGALETARATFAAELAADPGTAASVARARDALTSCSELLARDELPGAAELDGLRFEKRANALKTPAALRYLEALDHVREALVDVEAADHHALIDRLLRDFATRYEALKHARSGLDYDDLELVARDLLRDRPVIAAEIAGRFQRVMVDEFQDTNPRQLELLRLLGHGELFVVGDALQSIYGFRHADVRVFRAAQAEHRRAGTEALLQTNWRTVPEILRTLDNALGGGHEGYSPFLAGRTEPDDPDAPATSLLLVDARTGGADDPLPEEALTRLLDGLPSGVRAPTALEARAIARWVRAGVDAGEHRPQDVVLLLRAATDMPVYERALELEGLSTLASGGRGFWLRQQVQDLCSWLAALANPRDGHAVLSALASPLGGVGPDGLAIVSSVARRRARGDVWELLEATFGDGGPRPGDAVTELPADVGTAELLERIDSITRDRLAVFAARFRDERALLPWLALDDLVERIVAATEYDRHVLALPGGPRRLANVHKLMRLAAEHEALVGRDLRSFIDRAREEAEAQAREPEAPVELPGVPAVRLMTVHAAKGLQFPVVVVPDLERAPRNSGPDVLVDGERVGIRLPRHGDDSAPAFAFADLDEARKRAGEAEERRILHVALTRAERRLVLSAVAKLSAKEELGSGTPVAWIAEGVFGSRVPPAELRDAGDVVVGAAPGSPVRVRARWLDARHVDAELPAPGQPPVDPDAVSDSSAAAATNAVAALEPVLATVDPQAAPVRAPVVAHVSYSSLSRHARCGLRFHLERVAGLRERDRPLAGRAGEGELDARSRGSIVHRVLELHEFGGPPPTADDVRAAAGEVEATVTDGEATDLSAYVARALGTPLMARVAAAARARREATFAIPLAPGDPSVPLLLGVVDLVAFEDTGTALVVDYKTDRLQDDTDLDAVVRDAYGIQRTIYALAALTAGAKRVDVAHLYLDRPDEPALASYEAADADRLRADLRARAAGILSEDFAPTDEPHARVCAGCPGRGGLCPVPVELTRRPPPGSEEPAVAVPAGVAPLGSVAAPAARPRRPRPSTDGQTSLF